MIPLTEGGPSEEEQNAELEEPMGHSGREVKQTVGYKSMQFR